MNSTDRNLQTRDARNHSRFDVLNELLLFFESAHTSRQRKNNKKEFIGFNCEVSELQYLIGTTVNAYFLIIAWNETITINISFHYLSICLIMVTFLRATTTTSTGAGWQLQYILAPYNYISLTYLFVYWFSIGQRDRRKTEAEKTEVRKRYKKNKRTDFAWWE